VFELVGHDPNRVTVVTTPAYYEETAAPVAPRPVKSVLDLTEIESAGYSTVDADDTLVAYVRLETLTTQQQTKSGQAANVHLR
jgi:dTDP-4-dehydrorhamnose 3,5-epimerase